MQLIEFFDRGVQLSPERIAFVGRDGTDPITYAAAEALTHRVAGALQRDGMRAEDPVAVLGPNTPSLFPYVLGILRAGCAWVSLNARSTPSDLAGLLELVGARALLFSTEMGDAVKAIRAAVPSLEHFVAIDGPTGDRPHVADWLAPPGFRVPLPPLDPEAVAGFFGTGGTTGQPKAVEVPHRAFETMILAFNAHLPEQAPVNLVAAPLTHAAGAAVFPVLSLGGTNVVHHGVAPGEILESIERNRVTRLFLPPTAIYSLLAHPDADERDTSSLRYFLYGAAPMSVDKLEEAIRRFGPVMAQFYGQTELPMMCTFLTPAEHAEAIATPKLRKRLSSCGRPSVVANVAIMGEHGVLCDRGERGEIVVRSSLRMKGYHDDPAQTEAVLRDGDWLATGDVGYIDEDGFVYIVDRTRDMIISGGFNVYPSEVEQVIWSHPVVNDCAVIGVPDEKWGERVTAVVELKNGGSADASALSDELVSICKQRLGNVKAPKEIVFRDLPRSPVGKVLKRALRDEYWSGHERRV